MSNSIKRVWLTTNEEPLALEASKDIWRSTRHKRYRRYFPVAVHFVTKGPYTCAMIELSHWLKGSAAGAGFAKCRPTDKYDPLVGQRIAMRRAIEDAVNG